MSDRTGDIIVNVILTLCGLILVSTMLWVLIDAIQTTTHLGHMFN